MSCLFVCGLFRLLPRWCLRLQMNRPNRQAWTGAEEQILLRGVRRYGPNNWYKVSTLLRRDINDCRSHYDSLCSTVDSSDRLGLVSLSFLFPGQYRLVSSLTGKPANMCCEAYNEACLGFKLYSDGSTTECAGGPTNPYVLEIASDRLRSRKARKQLKKCR